ncbi:hypothetical protein UFOVP706_35 [uncultured Caudovirales phage]|uniref:Uncharacterized protein n=1 Tax=uncultured Caudovirales phage TaxID=2100421 RepID=A0A6J5NJG3_9CAUD|nr:hypothetical protein UFOVP706_35 [uncultured Caudovirales phage]
MSFKIGDRVRLTKTYYPLANGALGTVCQVEGSTYGGSGLDGEYLGVRLSVPHEELHDCQGNCNENHGYYIPVKYIEIIPLSPFDRLEASMNEAIALVEAGS